MIIDLLKNILTSIPSVFLNQTSFARFIRKERLEKNDMEERLSPKLKIHFVIFNNVLSLRI